MRLKIWHAPNPPGKIFEREVSTLAEAITILDTLADYDLMLGDNLIYSNAQGVVMFDEKDQEWVDYQTTDGDTLEDLRKMDLPSTLYTVRSGKPNTIHYVNGASTSTLCGKAFVEDSTRVDESVDCADCKVYSSLFYR